MRVRTFPCFHFLLFAVATDDTLPAALDSRLGVCVLCNRAPRPGPATVPWLRNRINPVLSVPRNK